MLTPIYVICGCEHVRFVEIISSESSKNPFYSSKRINRWQSERDQKALWPVTVGNSKNDLRHGDNSRRKIGA